MCSAECVSGFQIHFHSADPCHQRGALRRAASLVEAYNAIAKRVAARHNITFIDTYSIVFQLLDLSFDGAHYGGSIGHALAVTILDEVAEHT